jgi:hypothetical protein
MKDRENILVGDPGKTSWSYDLRLATGLLLVGCIMIATAFIGLTWWPFRFKKVGEQVVAHMAFSYRVERAVGRRVESRSPAPDVLALLARAFYCLKYEVANAS